MQPHDAGPSRDLQDPPRIPTTDAASRCEASTQEKLAAKLEKVKIRLEADAPNMRKPGAALVAHYLDPDRPPVHARWSRKHAHTQRRLCLLYVAPVIDAVTCQEIKTSHMQQIVNAFGHGGWRVGPVGRSRRDHL